MTIDESYKVLKLKPGATESEIRSAYKAQIKKYHPDTFKGDKNVATEKTMQINTAYRILTFKEKPSGPPRREIKNKKKFFIFRFFDNLKKKRKLKQKQKAEEKQNKINKKQQKNAKKENEIKDNTIAPEFIIIGIMAIILIFLVIWFMAAGK